MLTLLLAPFGPVARYAMVALLSGALAGTTAWRVQTWRHAANDLARVEAQAEANRHAARAVQRHAQQYEDQRHAIADQTRTITIEVDRIVDRPIYRDVCLDADGLRALTHAITWANADPAQPDGAVPAPEPAR